MDKENEDNISRVSRISPRALSPKTSPRNSNRVKCGSKKT